MKRVIAVVAVTAGILAGPAQATVSDGNYVGVIDLQGNMQFNVVNKTVYRFKWSNMRIACNNQIYHVTGALNRHANIQQSSFTMLGQDGQGTHVKVGGLFSGTRRAATSGSLAAVWLLPQG